MKSVFQDVGNAVTTYGLPQSYAVTRVECSFDIEVATLRGRSNVRCNSYRSIRARNKDGVNGCSTLFVTHLDDYVAASVAQECTISARSERPNLMKSAIHSRLNYIPHDKNHQRPVLHRASSSRQFA